MSIELDTQQQLFLWSLVVSGEGDFLSEIGKNLKAAQRKSLVKNGLIHEEKRKNPNTKRSATFLTLEDRGWRWCQEHLTDEIQSGSKQTAKVLTKLLGLLSQFFQREDAPQSLGDFIWQASTAIPDNVESTEDGSSSVSSNAVDDHQIQPSSLAETIRQVCLQLTDGKHNSRIRLADLRAKIDVSRDQLDENLLSMELAGDLSLYPLDDPGEIRPEDHTACLKTKAGSIRHLVYFEGLKP